MAPEKPAEVVVLDLSFQNGKLTCMVERVEGDVLRVSWNMKNPSGYVPIGGGVAYVREGKFTSLGPFPCELTQLDDDEWHYQWRDTDMPFYGLMLILILPEGFTLAGSDPEPKEAKDFNGRVALHWRLYATSGMEVSARWTLRPFEGDINTEVVAINRQKIAVSDPRLVVENHAGISWLHLSDWHQGGKDFNRTVVRDALIQDIQERTSISRELAQIDFVVFSGDVAFSGKSEQYQAAIEDLFKPVLEATELKSDRLFIVPGNHDLDRSTFDLLPATITSPFTSEKVVQTWLTDDEKRQFLLRPFKAYDEFVKSYVGEEHLAYASIHRREIGGKKVALLGLNSALMCGRKKVKKEVDDKGHLIVGEPQIHDALEQIADADIRIAVLHHPFDWLTEFDRNRIQKPLKEKCHFILSGHVHMPAAEVHRGAGGEDTVIIPAGACYDRREAQPHYINGYNFVHLNFNTQMGTVYLRRWFDDAGKWLEDVASGKDFEFSLPKSPI